MKNNALSSLRALLISLGGLGVVMATLPVAAATYGVGSPVSSAQRSTAQAVAQAGVPLSALAPDAPDEYTVRRGDTLWRISGMFLKSPWRWPELWGMNLNDIRNPHLIFPGQKLWLERVGDRAYLRTSKGSGDVPVVKVSPRNREEMLDARPITTLQRSNIEAFLTEPLVVDDDTFERAPRIVALGDVDRILIAKGDRAYVRGPEDAPVIKAPGLPTVFRVFRTAEALVDPETEEVLGYEGVYVGRAELVRGETETDEPVAENVSERVMIAGEVSPGDERVPESPGPQYLAVPATVDILSTKEEMRPGDRLLPDPPSEYENYVPHAPEWPVEARVISIYGNTGLFAGGNQVVAINKGLRDGLEAGDVLAVLTSGGRTLDRTDKSKALIQLPDERNGLAMVFRTFDRVSYVLVMEARRAVQRGDKLINPN